MIDRAARDEMALLLRRLATGRITNEEFEDALPFASRERAIWAIFREGVWPLYDDLHERRLMGKYRLTKATRREVAKYILFLKSNREYEWLRLGPVRWTLWLAANLLTLGLAGAVYQRWYSRDPDRRAWPFRNAVHLGEARTAPPFLSQGRGPGAFNAT